MIKVSQDREDRYNQSHLVEVVSILEFAITIGAVAMVLDFVLFERRLVGPSFVAQVAIVFEMVLIVHVLISGLLGPEAVVAPVTVERGLVGPVARQ